MLFEELWSVERVFVEFAFIFYRIVVQVSSLNIWLAVSVAGVVGVVVAAVVVFVVVVVILVVRIIEKNIIRISIIINSSVVVKVVVVIYHSCKSIPCNLSFHHPSN